MPAKVAVDRHVLVCTMVVETRKGTDIEDMGDNGVVPNLAELITNGVQDEPIGKLSGKQLYYCVRDVAVFTEHNFMQETRRYGHPARFPDVWLNGPPPELHVVNVDRKQAS